MLELTELGAISLPNGQRLILISYTGTRNGIVFSDALGAPMSDPDADGVPNLWEFAFNDTPTSATPNPRWKSGLSDTSPTGFLYLTTPGAQRRGFYRREPVELILA